MEDYVDFLSELFFALHTQKPEPDNLYEVAYEGYQRVPTNKYSWGFFNCSGRLVILNKSVIQFPEVAATTKHITVRHISLISVTSKLLYPCPLDSPLPLVTGSIPCFSSEAIKISTGFTQLEDFAVISPKATSDNTEMRDAYFADSLKDTKEYFE